MLTLEEWGALDEDEPGELVDGRLVEEEVPTVLHEAGVTWMIATLDHWGLERGVRVHSSELRYGVAPGRGRKPDVSAYLPGIRQPNKCDAVALVPPSIAVEVVSEPARDVRRDRIEKLADYARFGIRLYWLLDPFRRTFEALELGSDGRYALALSVSDGAHPIPGCDGLVLDLDELWQRLDALPDEG